jgi:hypothetical protein
LGLFVNKIDSITAEDFKKSIIAIFKEPLFNQNYYYNAMTFGSILKNDLSDTNIYKGKDYKVVLNQLKKELEISDLIDFVKEYFMTNPSRYTIELFANDENLNIDD